MSLLDDAGVGEAVDGSCSTRIIKWRGSLEKSILAIGDLGKGFESVNGWGNGCW
jgi:hypothetical protein